MSNPVRDYILEEASKCTYCGFCEPNCPTLQLGPHRGYGPRGRIRLALLLAKNSVAETKELEYSIFTCLLCAACTVACIAGVDVPSIVRFTRHILLEEG